MCFLSTIFQIQCELCGNSFVNKSNLQRHRKGNQLCTEKTTRKRKNPNIENGANQLRNNDDALNNISTNTADASISSPSTSNSDDTENIIKRRKLTKFTCKLCKKVFSTRRELYEHIHLNCLAENINLDLQDIPFTIDNEPWKENGQIDQLFEKTYNCNKKIILARHSRLEKVDSFFNFPVDNIPTVEILSNQLQEIFEIKQSSFKINMSAGYILQHTETKEFKYFRPAMNNAVFDFPILVSDHESFEKLKLEMKSIDLINHFQRNRENTKWKLIYMTNITYNTYSLNFVIGQPGFLPKFIKDHRYIKSLDRNPKNKQTFKDNFCIFRCLATHLKCIDIEKSVKTFFEKWILFCEEELNITKHKTKFIGFPIDQIPNFEKCFGLRVNIFCLNIDKTVLPIFISQTHFNDTLYLNLYGLHFSYITDFPHYANKFKCSCCNRHFTRFRYLKKHYRHCSKLKKIKLPGGYFKPPTTVFNDLASFNIIVPEQEQYSDYFAFFDFESILKQTQDQSTDNLLWTTSHIPISVAIASNITSMNDSKCYVNKDLDSLLQSMMNRLSELQNESYKLSKQKWDYVFTKLDDEIKKWEPKDKSKQINQNNTAHIANTNDNDNVNVNNNQTNNNEAIDTDFHEEASAAFKQRVNIVNSFERFHQTLHETNTIKTHVNNFDDLNISDEENDVELSDNELSDIEENEGDSAIDKTKYIMHKQLVNLKSKFELYCSQLCVFGFNNSNYDIPLIKSKLAKYLKLTEKQFTVKKANKYICISNPQFRFLDIANYLAAGVSYSQFLKAFEIPEQKSYFCYEWMQDSEQLKQTYLPEYEAFYSKLKSCNVLNEEYEKWEKTDKTKPQPKTGLQNYNDLKQIWIDRDMQTFEDFLIYYNLLDVEPAIKAITKLQTYFKDKGVDFMKSCVSIPGIARCLLFQHSREMNANFQLFSNETIDLYKTFKRNIIGGPSIIYKRKASANETYIRNNTNKPVKQILGLDANSLYCWSLSQDMPTGPFVVRREHTGFKPERETKYIAMFNWLDWIAKTENKYVKHKLNSNAEKRIGPYLVDGYCAETNTIFDFLGCYFHSCPKCTKVSDNAEINKKNKAKYEATISRLEYIESLNYNVKTIWECEYRKLVKLNTDLQDIENISLPKFYQNNKGSVTINQILDAVLNDEVFAAIEVDIITPNSLYDYFSEMSPLFCTTDIAFEDIGEHMQKFIRDFDLCQKPRKLLVGGYHANKILLASPLLKWYLNHGMKVTKIHKIIEYTGKNCFESFTEDVSRYRRMGDRAKHFSILGEMAKLLANSSYGSMILNQEAHTKIQYIDGATNLAVKMNSPYFKNCVELDDNIYEAELAKTENKITMPLQVGYWILQLAKLKMLSFYYNCLDYYLDRDSFELIEMDTDSYYFSLSELSLDECVKPTLKHEYVKEIYGSCTNGDKQKGPISWFPRKCCDPCKNWDRRIPGLFKEEFKGTQMVALCSKAYAVSSESDVKFSCKGVNKRTISKPFETMSNVLENKRSVYVTNIGFRSRDNGIKTYQQCKKGFSYLYCKREVLANGIDTKCLDIVLSPWLDKNEFAYSEDCVLSLNHNSTLVSNNTMFFSASQMYEYRKVIFHNNVEIAIEILNSNNLFQVKKHVKNFNISCEWYENAYQEMKQIYELKFNTCSKVKLALLQTQGKSIVECSKFDSFWANGYSERVTEVFNSNEYIGRNYSGSIWQEIRATITCDCGEKKLEYLNVIDNKYMCNICSFIFD